VPIYTSSGVGAGSSRATINELVERVYRDYLWPSDDQPVIVTVNGAVADDATSIVYDADALAPDEEDLLAPGVLAEIGTEQVRITAVDPSTDTLTVIRGVNGTEAAAITDGAELRLAPAFPRKTVYDAVCDNIVDLYPDLMAVGTQTITSATGAVEVSADIVSIRSATWISASRPVAGNVELLKNYPPSSTGQAVTFYGIPISKTVYLAYESRFPRPSSGDDVAGDLGVEETWERIVVVGAAAQVLAGRELDAASTEYLTEQLEREGFPVGSAQRIRDGLLRLHGYMLDRARRNQRADRTVPVQMSI
jgi:hypothetical protein